MTGVHGFADCTFATRFSLSARIFDGVKDCIYFARRLRFFRNERAITNRYFKKAGVMVL